jgi:glycosyltransferase involved in cell wall biosynthesis
MRLGGAQVVLKQLVDNVEPGAVRQFVYKLRNKGEQMPLDAETIEHSYFNYDPRKFFDIIRVCKQYDIDIIHAHLTKPIMGGLLAKSFCDVKVVAHEHGPVFSRGVQYSFYRFFLKLFAGRADRFIAVSEDAARGLRERAGVDGGHITVIPNAVDIGVFDPAAVNDEQLRWRLGICDDDYVIGFCGRVNEDKGADIIIKSMPGLLERRSDYLLVIVGSSGDIGRYCKLTEQLGVAERVRFAGFCDDVPAVMKCFDVGVVPSRRESFGLAAIEMMAMNVPVVSSGVSGLSEFMVDGDNAVIVRDNKPAEYCQAIERLRGDNELRDKLIANAHRTAEKYSVKAMSDEVAGLYKQILGRRNRND